MLLSCANFQTTFGRRTVVSGDCLLRRIFADVIVYIVLIRIRLSS